MVQVLIPHREDVKIESMSASQDYLVVFQRVKGLQVGHFPSAPSGPFIIQLAKNFLLTSFSSNS